MFRLCSCIFFWLYLMKKNNWNVILKVIIAVASAIAGVIGGQGLL